LDSTQKAKKYSEAALRLEAIIKSATDGIIVINEEGLIEEANQSAARLFGYDLDELLGHNINMLMPQPHREQHDSYIKNYLRTGVRKIIGIGREVEGLRKDGTRFPFRLSISEVKLEKRRIFTGIIYDLTEQKKAEKALWEEKEKAQMYFDLANTINVVLNPKGHIVELNKKGCAFIGKSEEEVVGKNWFDFFTKGEERKAVKAAFQEMMEGVTGLIPYYENAVYNQKGQLRYFSWHNNLIHDQNGKITGLITSGTDITERRLAKHALQKEKERAQRYLDVANTIIVVLNREGKVELLNNKGCEMLGYQEEEVLGKNWFELVISPEERLDVRETFQQLVENRPDVPEYYENEVVTHQGLHKLIAWHNAVIQDENGRPVATISSGIDITEQRAAERRIEKMNAELEERVEIRTEELAEAVNQLLNINKQLKFEIQERKAAEAALRKSEQELRRAYEREKELSELKSRFVSMASHEFRTPLSTILSSADIIEEYMQTEQQSRREKHTARIKSAVANLTGILNDFLSLSRLEEGKIEHQPVEFEISQFCREEVIDELQGLLKEDQQIRCQGIDGEREIHLDKKFLKNILFNLLSNAIKYSAPGTHIDLTMSIEKKHLLIKVEDQGIGIPEEEQQHLFTRFFRARNVENIQGTGLGLNIVKKYVDLMEGHITFESKLEEGTTFDVRIPLKRP
jgi:two-component system sensor kinase FixL